jgi:hypothetical protein
MGKNGEERSSNAISNAERLEDACWRQSALIQSLSQRQKGTAWMLDLTVVFDQYPSV